MFLPAGDYQRHRRANALPEGPELHLPGEPVMQERTTERGVHRFGEGAPYGLRIVRHVDKAHYWRQPVPP